MCWMCDHPDATYDVLRTTMKKNGWTVQYVENDRIPYAYTIGLHEHGRPELLATGVSPQRALRLLNAVARDSLQGTMFRPGEYISLEAGPSMETVAVDHPDVHMNMAVAFYGSNVRALQLVWADGRGRWPWAAGFCDGRTRQPVFGVRAQNA